MVVGRDSFTGDMLEQLGLLHVVADHSDRYPCTSIDTLDDAGSDSMLLPDEPHVLTAWDGPEAFGQTTTSLCSGRALTWYWPSLVSARAQLESVLAASLR